MGDDKGRVVCVTGAGGYVASWLIKLLLSKGYTVHGTVRNPGDEKNAHLYKLEKASDNLKLFKAELLDYESLYSAIKGCSGVFHVASPLPTGPVQNPQVEIIEPAVKGTLNVLKACVEAKVKRVIVVSSGTAVFMNPSWPKDRVKDETCWSDKEFQKKVKHWYGLSKTEAESEALEFGKTSELDVVTVCPVLVFGPMLQHTMNASSMHLMRQLKEGDEPRENKLQKVVDVRDVAEALVLVYEKPEAEGRYICSSFCIRAKDLVDKLKSIYPNYNYPKSFIDAEDEPKMTSQKLQKLGWSYRPLEETLVDSVESFKAAGRLD
ncbi:Epimerase domain-containing protein [Cephalotus follicularis]|uniref:Epimerase domain-containing protein n=1 Tax=Cephalotus follicularis TaxID=3775 RepID=A0A1Q3BCR5_CEPFO|nr:Epimerase domain-containing protein [Cephalotus follicularis]